MALRRHQRRGGLCARTLRPRRLLLACAACVALAPAAYYWFAVRGAAAGGGRGAGADLERGGMML